MPPLIQRVVLKNYKSIAACNVELRPLTFLVGPNGSGKSNFLDALRFVTDGLRTSLDHALRDRGGINDVRRRSGGHPTHFGIRLEFQLATGQEGFYAFRLDAKQQGGYEVQQEECLIQDLASLPKPHFFRVQSGEVTLFSDSIPPPALRDRLYLVNASGLPAFRPLFDALSTMGFYNLNPDRMRDLQQPDAGELLTRDGGNLASVLRQMADHHDHSKQRIEDYLSKIVPGVRGVDRQKIGTKETIEFRQNVAGQEKPLRFQAVNMSDGTLRALGVLVALLQNTNGASHQTQLVGIEEPEAALHPAAAGVLIDSLREASRERQVIVTSHSPDLIDDLRIATDEILAVRSQDGATYIGQLDNAGRTALRQELYTAGELLRMDQLQPDPSVYQSSQHHQLDIFDEYR